MKYSQFVITLFAAGLLAACQQGEPTHAAISKHPVGEPTGTVLNTAPVAPSTPAAPIANTAPAAPVGGELLGPTLNNSIGRLLDNGDRSAYDAAAQHILETGQPGQSMTWRNPQTGHAGSITAQNYSQNSTGQYCRDYTQTVVVNAQKEDGYGRACRSPDAMWHIVQ